MGMLISSNCCSGWYYKLLGTNYQNPFIWNLVKLSDLISLIKYIDTINFANYSFSFTEGEIEKPLVSFIKEKNCRKCSTLNLDNKAKFYYIHHHFNDNTNIISKDGATYGREILKYLDEKYKIRSARLVEHIKNGGKITFVYCDDERTNDMDFMDFVKLKTKHNKILLTKTLSFKKFDCDNFKSLVNSELKLGDTCFSLAKYMLETPTIMEFINGKMNKKVIYTCISGPYDVLVEPQYVSGGYDYVCFTDQPFNSNVWDIRPIPSDLSGLTTQKQNRYIKTHPHRFFPEYDFSIWVDSNVRLKGDVNEFVNANCKKTDGVFFAGQHPDRNCLYQESLAVVASRKDKADILIEQVGGYEKEGFPKNYGL